MRLHSKTGLEASRLVAPNIKVPAQEARQEEGAQGIYGNLGRVSQNTLLHPGEAAEDALAVDNVDESNQFAKKDVAETGDVGKREGEQLNKVLKEKLLKQKQLNKLMKEKYLNSLLKKKHLEEENQPQITPAKNNPLPNFQELIEDQEISNIGLVKNTILHSIREGEGALRMHLEAGYSQV